MSEVRALSVPAGLEGERVDTALARLFGFSRTRAADLAGSGAVMIGSRVAVKSDRVSAGELLEVEFPAPRDSALAVVAEPVPGMRVVYDDTELVVVDKPAGVAAHASAGWSGWTVVGGLAGAGYRISTSGAPERQGIVQRLDVGTSGLMVVAKSERAYSVLKQAFRDRRVDKSYHALVQGLPDPITGTIDAPIGRRPGAEFKFAVRDDGKHSITHYELLEAHRAASLLRIRLETGRTHQIRVHFAALHHPCVGDAMYGADPVLAARLGLGRQWLHANELGFEHPGSGEWVTFDSPYPAELSHALDLIER